MARVTLRPERMSCASIAGTLKGIMVSLDGVNSVDVEYDVGVFYIDYDDVSISPQTIIDHVGKERGIVMEVVDEDQ